MKEAQSFVRCSWASLSCNLCVLGLGYFRWFIKSCIQPYVSVVFTSWTHYITHGDMKKPGVDIPRYD